MCWLKVSLVLTTSTFSIGCKSLSSTENDSEKSVIAESFEFDADFSQNLPTSLWSPSKRKINANYYFMVAEYEMLGSNLTNGQNLYQATYNLDPSPLVAKKLLASMAMNGQIDQALVNARKMTLIHPKNPELHIFYGRLLLELGNPPESAKSFQKAVQLDPSNADGYLGLISSYKSQKLISKAIDAATTLANQNIHNAEIWSILAELHLYDQNISSAAKASEKAYRLSPDDPEKILLFSLVSEMQSLAFNNNLLVEAFKKIKNFDTFLKRTVLLYRQIDNPEFLVSSLKSKTKPTESSLFFMTTILWANKNYPEAITTGLNLLNYRPYLDNYIYLVGLIYEHLDQTDLAIAEYGKIGPTSTVFMSSRIRIINTLKNKNQITEAISIANDTIEQPVDGLENIYGIGAQLLASQKNLPEVINLLKKGTTRFPYNNQMYYYLGVYYEQNNQTTESIASIKKALELKPNHDAALNFLGYTYAELGINLDEAEKLIEKAIAIKPNSGTYLDSLGYVFFKQEKFDKAEAFFTKAAQASPDEGVIVEHLGDLAYATDNIQKSRDYFKKALKLKLEDRDKIRILKKLNDIEGLNG